MSAVLTHHEQVGRLRSLDVFRGVVVILLLSGTYSLFREGFGIGQVADAFRDAPLLNFLKIQLSHSMWEGCTLWDLIMPAFVFVVGVAMPFSYARRVHLGSPHPEIVKHAALRAGVLVVLGAVGFIILGNLLMGRWPRHINVDFSNALPQIGLSYFFAFLTVGKGLQVQVLTAMGILVGDWVAFVTYPVQMGIVAPEELGVSPDATRMTGLFAHWNRDANLAADFDRWLMNLIPRTDPYLANSTGIQTLNFVPTVSSMIAGVAVGEFLRKEVPSQVKLSHMTVAGFLCLGVGFILGETICPIVEQLWTPSWALYSTGWVLLAFTVIYGLVEVRGMVGWTFPFVVAGMNPVTAYCIASLFDRWIAKAWELMLGKELFLGPLGGTWLSIAAIVSVWSLCFVQYRRGVTIRV